MDQVVVNRVLMVAFHYPPLRGSSGIQRTLSFSRQLPTYGWEPLVLSASRSAYPHTSSEQACGTTIIHRSAALDAARHLSIRGRYPAWLARPDRWISWWLSAVPTGLWLIRRFRPALIWSTYPIATAHLIALALHRMTGLPWVADQRDPLTDFGYPADMRTRAIHHWLEHQLVRHASALVCTAPGALRDWSGRFPELRNGQLALIENGYDEASFPAPGGQRPAQGTQPFKLLHSGIVYPSERDPTQLFAALAELQQGGAIDAASFKLLLRDSGHDALLDTMIRRHGIQNIVELAPALGYREALAEMMSADGLLLLQASNCNAQIPAKLYEYLRARRPILALTDPQGDTARQLRSAGIDTIGRLDSLGDIKDKLLNFMRLCHSGSAPLANDGHILQQERAVRSRQLASLLDRISAGRNT